MKSPRVSGKHRVAHDGAGVFRQGMVDDGQAASNAAQRRAPFPTHAMTNAATSK